MDSVRWYRYKVWCSFSNLMSFILQPQLYFTPYFPPSSLCCPLFHLPLFSPSHLSFLLAAHHRHPHQPSHQRPAPLLCYHRHRHKTGRTDTNELRSLGNIAPITTGLKQKHTLSRTICSCSIFRMHTFLSWWEDILLNKSGDVKNMIMSVLFC